MLLDAFTQFEYVFVAVGSSQLSRTPENPFTVGERHAMIKESLEEQGFSLSQFKVVPVPDIDDDAAWPEHLLSRLGAPVSAVISGNPEVSRLIKKSAKGVSLITPKKKYAIDATQVREALLKGEDLTKFVPDAAQSFLKKIGAARKLTEIHEELLA